MTNIGNIESVGMHKSIPLRTTNYGDSRISHAAPIIISFTEEVAVYYLKMGVMSRHFLAIGKKTMHRLPLKVLL